MFARGVTRAVEFTASCGPASCEDAVDRNTVLGKMNTIIRVLNVIAALFAGYLMDKVSTDFDSIEKYCASYASTFDKHISFLRS